MKREKKREGEEEDKEEVSVRLKIVRWKRLVERGRKRRGGEGGGVRGRGRRIKQGYCIMQMRSIANIIFIFVRCWP